MDAPTSSPAVAVGPDEFGGRPGAEALAVRERQVAFDLRHHVGGGARAGTLDEFGEEVCEDRAYDHYPVCTVIPAFTGRFRVDIINRGRVWTRTQILSN